jgi:rhamnulose-1-phosphate aldolase
MKDYLEVIDNMYRLGWDERNGGNVSYLLDEKDVNEYLDGGKKVIRTIPLPLTADPILKGRSFIFTGTGRYFRNTLEYPSENVGVIRIGQDLKTAEVLWGFDNNSRFTSEIFAHLMCHATRLKKDPNHHIVMHTHPTNLLIMTHVHPLDEVSFSTDLWRTMTECVIVFPEGVGVLPWMLCGTNEIGVATAKKMEEFRVVIWGLHGVYGCGETIDEAFGLIETVEKAAQLYLGIHQFKEINSMSDKNLYDAAGLFKAVPHEGYLKK